MIDKKSIVNDLISHMDKNPDDHAFFERVGSYSFEIDSLSQAKGGAYLDRLKNKSNSISVYFSMGFGGTVSSCWKVYVGDDFAFKSGFFLGFKIKKAIKRLDKIKQKQYEERLSSKINNPLN